MGSAINFFGAIVKFSKVFTILIVLTLCVLALTSCSASGYYTVMGTDLVVDVKVRTGNPEKAAKTVYQYMQALNLVLSPTEQGSDLERINSAPIGTPISCHAETLEIMSVAKYVYDMSDGAYDPSVYPLVKLWQFDGGTFGTGTFVLPSDLEILATKQFVGLDKAFAVDYENRTITKLVLGAELDFGGIAKGYASDRAREIVNVKNMLVYLGGNISAKGTNYKIGVGNPTRKDRRFATPYFGIIDLKDGECVSTSGDYERYYELKVGEVTRYYHHILDPKTGYPVDTSGDDGVVSATVISTNGAFADAVATAIVVLGKEKGLALLAKLKEDARYDFSAVLIDGNFNHVTFGNVEFELEK